MLCDDVLITIEKNKSIKLFLRWDYFLQYEMWDYFSPFIILGDFNSLPLIFPPTTICTCVCFLWLDLVMFVSSWMDLITFVSSFPNFYFSTSFFIIAMLSDPIMSIGRDLFNPVPTAFSNAPDLILLCPPLIYNFFSRIYFWMKKNNRVSQEAIGYCSKFTQTIRYRPKLTHTDKYQKMSNRVSL